MAPRRNKRAPPLMPPLHFPSFAPPSPPPRPPRLSTPLTILPNSSGDLSAPASACSVGPSTPTRACARGEMLTSPRFDWDVPRPPPSDVEPDYPSLKFPSPLPSPRSVPRADFRKTPAPVVARGGTAFTPRPTRVREASPASPSRLGRKISLNNLGPAYAAVEAETLHLEVDEAVEELDDSQGDSTFASTDSYPGLASSSSFPGFAKLGPPVELKATPRPQVEPEPEPEGHAGDQGEADEEATLDYALDLDEVDLELDIRHLSLTSTSPANTSSSEGGSAPTTPGGGRDLAAPSVPMGALSPALSAISTSTLSKSGTTDSLCSATEGFDILPPGSPNGTFDNLSPSSPPPMRAPSVPATPQHEATGYASDESDVIVPHRRLVARRIIVSDDEDAPPRPRGLRGRIPAAIARLNSMNSDQEDEDESPEFLMDSSMDSAGSLREFVLSDSEVEEDVADGGEDDEEQASLSESDGSDSDAGLDSDELIVGETLPIPVINLVSDSEEDGPPPVSPAVLTFEPAPPPITVPDIGSLSLSEPAPALAPRSKPRKQMSTREWEAHREKYAQSLFDELDASVFGARLGRAGASCTIKWDARINKSAGMAHRRATRHKDGSRTHEVWIALASKVLSEERQVRDTLAHEMCHVAAWVVDAEFRNPHGRVFKAWGRKVMRARPDISVTTKHDYTIHYKYEWQCTDVACRKVYRRHSKSIDPAKQVCGACRARLAPLFATKELSPYQLYVKAYMKTAQAAMPGATFGQISRALSDRWTAAKGASDAEHAAYWREFRRLAA
ncbi:hypothetical protein CC85DRAFT_267591 [Cutaneotrichosporon oleaginosum]|uniref:SprT-like domain-containing protein n=1 Tax=Cutaneotrichosporon oleaginosum TaxID=879819 RepID=A0A0J0XZF9_9TREE|nr:uncharacterized protein CC85DRAFT_267591 [Cutaneotrichosporon oleaginosum]KLT46426.1 hypothetical protein CC85DRAFT_267591 [Cutaneotrichosporon oleaginosum]TXT15204.1 hypothetical protein COLE_01397 [Cutaneotrichosporon oleaginosum]